MDKPGQEPGKKTVLPMFKGLFGGNGRASPTSKIVTSSDMKGGIPVHRNSKLQEESKASYMPPGSSYKD